MSEAPPAPDEPSGEQRRRRFLNQRGVLFLLCTPALLFFTYLAYLTVSLPSVAYLRHEDPDATRLMRQRWAEERAEGRTPRRIQEWVRLEEVSDKLIQAVIMGEDASFYVHHGFDFYEMKESIVRNWERRRFARGASTITQQLAKNLFLSTEKSLTRKLKEAALTYRLEKALTKRRILEIYLNVIEWGDGIYGVEAAARIYLGKRAVALDAAEGALLAAMIPSPRRLDPRKNMRALKIRQRRILGWMRMAGYLTEDGYREALEEPLRARNPLR